jgi:hypothetical protein
MRAAKIIIALFLLSSFLQNTTSGKELQSSPQSGTHVPGIRNETREPSLQIVELVFNGKSAGTCRCFSFDNTLWIPFDLFKEQTAPGFLPESNGIITISTSIGKLSLDSGNDLRQFEKNSYISAKTLEKKLFIVSRFNQEYYSLDFDIPWRAVKKETEINNHPPDDYCRAPAHSVSFVHLEGDYLYDPIQKSSPDNHFLFEAGGRVAGGIWDVVSEKNYEGNPVLSRYHWTTYSDNAVVRIGSARSSPYFLMPDIPFSGIQAAWSNRSIMPYIDNAAGSKNDSFLSVDREQSKTLEGTGPVAGIAELRIDGVVTARQRIGIDGKYVFYNVRMYSDFRSIQVFLYQHSLLEKPMKVIDFSRSMLGRMLAGRELLVKTGAGFIRNVEGNRQFPDLFSGQVLYGVTDRLTLEGNVQYNSLTGRNDFLLGAVASLGSHWAVSIYGASVNGLYSGEATAEGHYPFADVYYRGLFSRNDVFSGGHSGQKHNFRLNARLSGKFTALLYGQYGNSGADTSRFVLPGFFWQIHPSIRITAIPDFDRKYHVETWMKLSANQDLTLSYSEREQRYNADYRYDLSQYIRFRLEEGYLKNPSGSVTSIFFDWNPDSNYYNIFSVGATCSRKKAGYFISWHKYLNPGLQFTLTYSSNHSAENYVSSIDDPLIIPADNKKILYATFSWDLGMSAKGLKPVNREEISLTRGGISGSFVFDNSYPAVDADDINGVNILMNGEILSQRQLDGSFFVGDLKKGIYEISFETESLPIELSISKVQKKIEVKPCSVTSIEIPVYVQYGVAGKIHCEEKEYKTVKVSVVSEKDGLVAAQKAVNEFGYYRFDGLKPGKYTVKAEKTADGGAIATQRDIEIRDCFLFGVDLEL